MRTAEETERPAHPKRKVMPKYTPTIDDLVFDKWCAYCGEPFLPNSNEVFCSARCETADREYMEDLYHDFYSCFES